MRDDEQQWFNFQDAARRVDRSLRTLRRWKAAGLPTVMLDGTNYVAHDDLLAWWSAQLLAEPLLQRHKERLARERCGTGGCRP